MLKKLLSPVLFLFIATIGNAQISKYTAPLSKEYIEYVANKKAKVQGDASEHSLGYIPSPVKFIDSYTNLPDSATDSISDKLNNGLNLMDAANGLPAVFDLRKNKTVSSVKNQGTGDFGGNCWAFACMSSIESGWMVKGLSEFDLSEQNLVNCNGYAWGYGQGGNEFLDMGYLSRMQGPISETDDPYSSLEQYCLLGKTPVALSS